MQYRLISSALVFAASALAAYVPTEPWSTLTPSATLSAGTTDYTGTFGIAIETISSAPLSAAAKVKRAVSQIGDGQVQATTGVVSQIGDGQVQATTAVVSQIGDGQVQATTAVVSQIGDGQVQATTAVVSQIGDGQIQATTGVVSQIGDGQVQATTGVVSQIGDGQVQATTGVVSQIGDGQVQATTGVVSQIGDGQVQATTAVVASQISDGQAQATASGVSQISDGQAQATGSSDSASSTGLVAVSCKTDDSLAMTLSGGILTDAKGRIGSIVANRQFQFDGPPPQAGAIYAAGWSISPEGYLAIGDNTEFYQCLSGTFYNLYDEDIGSECYAVHLAAVGLVDC